MTDKVGGVVIAQKGCDMQPVDNHKMKTENCVSRLSSDLETGVWRQHYGELVKQAAYERWLPIFSGKLYRIDRLCLQVSRNGSSAGKGQGRNSFDLFGGGKYQVCGDD